MAENSNIGWTHHTWSPWRGCNKVSDGCKNCYAETLSKRNPGVLGVWGPSGARVINKDWSKPLRWDKAAAKAGERHRVFPSLCDPFEDRPELVEPRVRFFHLINETPHLDWLVLTKRPENIRRFWGGEGVPRSWAEATPPNLWLGVSVENQKYADERIPILLDTPAAVRFVSYEPALGPVDFSEWLKPWLICFGCGDSYGLEEAVPDPDGHDHGADKCARCGVECCMVSVYGDAAIEAYYRGERNPDGTTIGSEGPLLDWIICGGESGPNRRPCEVEWFQRVVDDCRAAGVAAFVKQDMGPKPGLQGRISDELWAVKQFPKAAAIDRRIEAEKVSVADV